MKKNTIISTVFLIISTVCILFIIKFYSEKNKVTDNEETTEEIYDEFNMNISTHNKMSKKIANNQTIGQILNNFDISYTDIDRIVKLSSPLYDFKNIRSGNSYHLYFSNDTLQTLEHFIYEISISKHLLINFKDSITVDLIEREIKTKISKTSGVITSSLWHTIKKIKADPNLALKLSDVFAWVIDFYRIQKNDKFKVIYEKEFLNDEAIGIGRIKAAVFEHGGKTFYAYLFQNDSVNEYFNEKAESMRKAFLKAPLKFSRITSGFSNKRFHPVLKKCRPHLGTDYAAPTGTPIMAVGDGEVIEARYHGGNGNYVKIRHNSVYTTQYLHMSRFAKGIKPGVRVSQGDIIGYVGSTGLATGPHVCFRFWKNGVQINHLKEEFPNTAPLDSCYHQEFFKNVEWYNKAFERMSYN